jgi:F-type H+-transporting ATPase subunit b
MATAPHEVPETGMPQLDFSTFPNQIFWLVVTLIVIYFVLSKVALPRIGAVLSDRQDTIEHDIAKAEELKQMAGEAEIAYNLALATARLEATEIISQTKRDIKAKLMVAISAADEKISSRVKEGEKKIHVIKESSKESILIVAQDIASDIVKAVGPGKVDSKIISSLVSEKVKA